MGANPFEAMMRMFGGMSGAAPGAPVLPPRERFASQLRQLQDMGFADEELNIQILEQTNGNVDAALNFYFS
eukprot:m.56563 g.56563  ORF g.56563 m.56563 type:complete len:71 (+) comp12041_c0_seq1:606-818(+)